MGVKYEKGTVVERLGMPVRWRSSVASSTPCRTQVAAIQMSLTGIGFPTRSIAMRMSGKMRVVPELIG